MSQRRQPTRRKCFWCNSALFARDRKHVAEGKEFHFNCYLALTRHEIAVKERARTNRGIKEN